MTDPLENGGFTKFDYEFLTGTWEGGWGACMGVVMEYCHNKGLGTYGEPTELGKKAIAKWEHAHKM